MPPLTVKLPIFKLLWPWTLIITGLIAAYFLFTQVLFTQGASLTNGNLLTRSQAIQAQSLQRKKQADEQQALVQAKTKHLEQEKVIKQRLSEKFENAFLKQYTPPVGCEDWQNKPHMANCTRHKSKAKQAYKQEFIQRHGLPKGTFDHQQLSFQD